jgi:hypothetical protein
MLNAERQRDYRKRKAQENKTSQASTSTDPTPTPFIIKRMDTFKTILLVIHFVIPATCVIDYGK